MPLLLREIEGYKLEDEKKYNCSSAPFGDKKSKAATDVKEAYEPIAKVNNEFWSNKEFTARIEALHCYPHATGNFTRYMSQACKASLQEWTEPYERPTIMYHNDYDGVVNGRIKNAYMGTSELSGTDCLMLEASAPEWKTRDGIMSGILKTVSVGVSGTDVRCSICGAQLSEGEFCEHIRGNVYDGQTCYWDVYEFIPKELSYVIVPSDKYAQVVGVITADYAEESEGTTCDSTRKTVFNLTNKECQKSDKTLDMREGLTDDIKQKEINDSNMDEKDKKMAEALKMNENLQTSITALQNDKVSLTEQLAEVTKEKVSLQEDNKTLKEQIAAKDLEITQQKELREAQEKENEKLQKEMKVSLVETLTALREKANKSKIEKLEERSLDSLRDSINDLKEELKVQQLQDAKIENPTLDESDQNVNKNQKDLKEQTETNNQESVALVL